MTTQAILREIKKLPIKDRALIASKTWDAIEKEVDPELEDAIFGKMMEKAETGKLVSKAYVLKKLRGK